MEQSRNEAFVESLQNYSLSELEDIYAHLDRDLFPERFDQVRDEIEARLKDFDSKATGISTLTGSPGFLRRIASSAIDFSMQVLVPFLIFFLLKSVLFPSAPTASAGVDAADEVAGDAADEVAATINPMTSGQTSRVLWAVQRTSLLDWSKGIPQHTAGRCLSGTILVSSWSFYSFSGSS